MTTSSSAPPGAAASLVQATMAATSWTHPNQAAIDEIILCQHDVKNVQRMLQFTREMANTTGWPSELRFSYEIVMQDLTALIGQLQVHRSELWLGQPVDHEIGALLTLPLISVKPS